MKLFHFNLIDFTHIFFIPAFIKNKNFVRFFITMLFFSLTAITNQSALAQDSNLSLKQLLLMPGKLTQAHAKIENKCNKCHLNFDKTNKSPLCLACHKEIKKDLKNSMGFHSKIAKSKIKHCDNCHTDHQGRDFDITFLDIDHFDHTKTDFSLKGSHQKLSCNNCHKKNNKNFRLTLKSGQCRSCHQDPHQGKLKNNCSKCHNEKNWQVPQFDHSTTSFLLKGKHQQVACKLCHVNDVSITIGDQCSNCHLSNDKHLGVFGNKCDRCHTERTWQKKHFNHFKETKIKLKGIHQSLACSTCHTQAVSLIKKPRKSCNSCHSADDIHTGKNGTNCQQCHNNKTWKKTTFNHNKDTKFHLQGAHKKLDCDACHLPNTMVKSHKKQKNKAVRRCNDCHSINDPHLGKLGKNCQNCHQQQKWTKNITFDHDFTPFPLTGAHQLLVCQSCHNSADFEIKSFKCNDCHNADDIHNTTLGKKCEQCHNTSSWSTWQFNHQKQTKFALTGAHRNLSCNNCHNNKLSKPLSPPKNCFACHQNDDAHQGSFGQNCQKCHNTESFNEFQH